MPPSLDKLESALLYNLSVNSVWSLRYHSRISCFHSWSWTTRFSLAITCWKENGKAVTVYSVFFVLLLTYNYSFIFNCPHITVFWNKVFNIRPHGQGSISVTGICWLEVSLDQVGSDHYYFINFLIWFESNPITFELKKINSYPTWLGYGSIRPGQVTGRSDPARLRVDPTRPGYGSIRPGQVTDRSDSARLRVDPTQTI
jgi:hypothetical protein